MNEGGVIIETERAYKLYSFNPVEWQGIIVDVQMECQGCFSLDKGQNLVSNETQILIGASLYHFRCPDEALEMMAVRYENKMYMGCEASVTWHNNGKVDLRPADETLQSFSDLYHSIIDYRDKNYEHMNKYYTIQIWNRRSIGGIIDYLFKSNKRFKGCFNIRGLDDTYIDMPETIENNAVRGVYHYLCRIFTDMVLKDGRAAYFETQNLDSKIKDVFCFTVKDGRIEYLDERLIEAFYQGQEINIIQPVQID